MPLTGVFTVAYMGSDMLRLEAAGTSVCDESVVETSVITAHSTYYDKFTDFGEIAVIPSLCSLTSLPKCDFQ